jgi:glycerol-3-phosphate dehydrogenase (NAD(P)+)
MGRRVTVLGGGAMGTACALLLTGQPEVEVRLWVRTAVEAQSLTADRVNGRYLPGILLPETLAVTSEPEAALTGADWLVVAIPTAFLRQTLAPLAGHVPAGARVISVIKGIEVGTHLRPSEILREVLGPRPVVAVCGPCHAEEMAKQFPTSVVAAGDVWSACEAAAELFRTSRYRVYTCRDLVGVELAGALKNVVAIAAGVSDGLGFGDNAKAALLSRACVEMARFGAEFGANPGTFLGLAGIGDLMTTCFSPYGRNRKIGIGIGRGLTLAEALETIPGVAEGVTTCRSVRELAVERRLDLPIVDAVHQIRFEGVSPIEATTRLMTRAPREETLTITI